MKPISCDGDFIIMLPRIVFVCGSIFCIRPEEAEQVVYLISPI